MDGRRARRRRRRARPGIRHRARRHGASGRLDAVPRAATRAPESRDRLDVACADGLGHRREHRGQAPAARVCLRRLRLPAGRVQDGCAERTRPPCAGGASGRRSKAFTASTCSCATARTAIRPGTASSTTSGRSCARGSASGSPQPDSRPRPARPTAVVSSRYDAERRSGPAHSARRRAGCRSRPRTAASRGIRGDADDPFSKGFICPKGSTLGTLHEDPDRLRRPLVRRDGDARRGELGARHSPRSSGASRPSSPSTAPMPSPSTSATRTRTTTPTRWRSDRS